MGVIAFDTVALANAALPTFWDTFGVAPGDYEAAVAYDPTNSPLKGVESPSIPVIGEGLDMAPLSHGTVTVGDILAVEINVEHSNFGDTPLLASFYLDDILNEGHPGNPSIQPGEFSFIIDDTQFGSGDGYFDWDIDNFYETRFKYAVSQVGDPGAYLKIHQWYLEVRWNPQPIASLSPSNVPNNTATLVTITSDHNFEVGTYFVGVGLDVVSGTRIDDSTVTFITPDTIADSLQDIVVFCAESVVFERIEFTDTDGLFFTDESPFSVTGSGGVEISGIADSEFSGEPIEITGSGGVEVEGTAIEVLSVDISGLYTIEPNKTNDTLYVRLPASEETEDVKIPDPFAKTAYLGY